MQAFDAVLEFALLALFVGICGYAVRLMFTTMRGDEAARAAARAARAPELTVVEAHRTVEALIEAVAAPGEPDVVEALHRLTEALQEEAALRADRRAEVAERLHAEGELPGRVASTARRCGRAWSPWGPVVSGRLLPPP